MNDPVVTEVSRKNAAAVMETLARQDKKIEEQNKRIDGLNAALSTMALRLNDLERYIAEQRAKALGSGPTVK